MAFTIREIDEIPSTHAPHFLGYRKSLCWDIIQQVLASPTKAAEITDDDQTAQMNLYKSLVQWRLRHTEFPLIVRKIGDVVYVAIPKEGEATVRRTRRPAARS
jgi:hypothetical protein